MTESQATATPQAAKGTATVHPPVQENQKAVEPEIDRTSILDLLQKSFMV